MTADLVADTVAAFCAKTPASKRIAAAARPVLADKTPLSMPFVPSLKEAYYPVVADRSEGAALWDIDGNRYIDILMGLGCNLLGHNPPQIRAALQDRLARGIQIGPQSEIAHETAALFARLTGHDRVTFSVTGTEAIMTAIRLARAETGRSKVAVFSNSYHGHADSALMKAQRLEYIRRGALERVENSALRALAPLLRSWSLTRTVPGFAGIPGALGRDVMMLEYGSPRALDIIRRKGRRLAAVLVEPVQSRMPELQPRGFLQDLRAVTKATGTALIFDEMISGFRVAQGGAQAHFGVQADLATYGKIAGGGLPLSLIAGQRRFMDRVDGGAWQFGDNSAPGVVPTFFAGTHARHPLALSAAWAMGQILETEGPALQKRLNTRTAGLVAALNDGLTARGAAVKFAHFGSFFAIAGSQSRMPPIASAVLSLLLLADGIHLRPGDHGGFLSTAHSDAEIAAIESAFLRAFDRLSAGGLLPQTGALQ